MISAPRPPFVGGGEDVAPEELLRALRFTRSTTLAPLVQRLRFGVRFQELDFEDADDEGRRKRRRSADDEERAAFLDTHVRPLAEQMLATNIAWGFVPLVLKQVSVNDKDTYDVPVIPDASQIRARVVVDADLQATVVCECDGVEGKPPPKVHVVYCRREWLPDARGVLTSPAAQLLKDYGVVLRLRSYALMAARSAARPAPVFEHVELKSERVRTVSDGVGNLDAMREAQVQASIEAEIETRRAEWAQESDRRAREEMREATRVLGDAYEEASTNFHLPKGNKFAGAAPVGKAPEDLKERIDEFAATCKRMLFFDDDREAYKAAAHDVRVLMEAAWSAVVGIRVKFVVSPVDGEE